MKIVIVGCGKVGTSIARELISTKHEITVVDINRKAVTRLSETLDVMGVVGNGATFQALADAGAETADLVIAATASDEVNLYACLMARSAGVPHTIARVRSPEYTNDLHRVKDQLGLSMSINPELTEAVEISRLLRFSGALEIDSFAKGAVELIKAAASRQGMSSIEATYRWLAYHSMLNGDRGDAILVGASRLHHLQQNMATIKAGPLPQDVAEAFEKAWTITRGDSPEYFTLYKGKGSVGGEKK